MAKPIKNRTIVPIFRVMTAVSPYR